MRIGKLEKTVFYDKQLDDSIDRLASPFQSVYQSIPLFLRQSSNCLLHSQTGQVISPRQKFQRVCVIYDCRKKFKVQYVWPFLPRILQITAAEEFHL
ncbi:unnamed protein product [Calypogeia fissa]